MADVAGSPILETMPALRFECISDYELGGDRSHNGRHARRHPPRLLHSPHSAAKIVEARHQPPHSLLGFHMFVTQISIPQPRYGFRRETCLTVELHKACLGLQAPP